MSGRVSGGQHLHFNCRRSCAAFLYCSYFSSVVL